MNRFTRTLALSCLTLAAVAAPSLAQEMCAAQAEACENACWEEPGPLSHNCFTNCHKQELACTAFPGECSPFCPP